MRSPADRHRELREALLPAGEFAVLLFRKGGGLREVEHFVHRHRVGVVGGGDVDQLPHPKVWGERHFLHHDPELAPGVHDPGRFTEDGDLARRGFLQPEQQRNRGGFAGPVGAEDGE